MIHLPVNGSLELKLLERSHTEALYALTDRNRHYLREWLPWIDATTSASHTRVFVEAAIHQFANDNGFQCGIFYEGMLAGCIGFHNIDWKNRKTSIGYWLGAEFQGRGLMTSACRTLVHYAMSELKLNRVEIRAGVYNYRSRAIPQRLGFTYEGIVRQVEWLYDHYIDHVIYGLLAEEYARAGVARRAAP